MISMFTCTNCGEEFSTDDMFFSDILDSSYCVECGTDVEMETKIDGRQAYEESRD